MSDEQFPNDHPWLNEGKIGESLYGMIDDAGGIVLTGGGVALTREQLARFVVLLAAYLKGHQ